MASSSTRFRLTERSARDLADIFVEGIERHGSRQAVSYQDELEAVMDLIGENPRMGRLAHALGRGVRRHEHAAHVIIYEEAEHGILVLAIVHGRSIRKLRL